MDIIKQEYIAKTKIILPLRGMTIFPNVPTHFDVGRGKSIKGIELAMERGEDVFLITQRNLSTEEPAAVDLYTVGVIVKIKQILKIRENIFRILVEGKSRGMLVGEVTCGEYFSASVLQIPDDAPHAATKRDKALIRNLRDLFVSYAEVAPKMSNEMMMSVLECEKVGYMADIVAQEVALDYGDKQEILEELNPRRRIALLIKKLSSEIEIVKLEEEIDRKTRAKMDRGQREFYLREQQRIILNELGDDEDMASEVQKYIEKICMLGLLPENEEKLIREVSRLGKLQPMSPESGVIRSYIDTCLELPWNKKSKENGNIKKAETILNLQHYGLEKVKERILELFAVKLMAGNIKGQIICLVGPPGVGKTSIARSIAQSLGRNYARLSLGGVRDEADIRGHRKTYIGAMPGRIIAALKQAGAKNALILVDEIDKMGTDMRGDPAAALLEVFDTEQNFEFRDHYIELPFDLSDVLFVTTANSLDTVPRPLLDRMEIIEISGYTDEEKLNIAKKHLVPKQLEKHGLCRKQLKISDSAIKKIIRGYTREAGVRTFERELAHLCRKVDKKIITDGAKSVSVMPDNVSDFLGNAKFKEDVYSNKSECGVVNGLAWTSVGGEILEVEALVMEGTGKLSLTGNLGDVMKESAQAAISYIRSHAADLNLAHDWNTKTDIHIHFPEGAIPKDGPSAGITTATALVSALTNTLMPQDIAMTGEVTIRGRVLPIGGLREKTMAAYRAGMKAVIIPFDNESDLQDIDPTVAKNITFHTAKTMDDVLHHALGLTFSKIPQNNKIPEESHNISAINFAQ